MALHSPFHAHIHLSKMASLRDNIDKLLILHIACHHMLVHIKYQDFAIATAVYTINRLPQSTLQNKSPFLSAPRKKAKYPSFACIQLPMLSMAPTIDKPRTRTKIKDTCIIRLYCRTYRIYQCLNVIT